VDRVAPEKIVVDPSRSIRDGALRPTLKNGYTVYSQVTVDVMDQICRAHGFDVDTPTLIFCHIPLEVSTVW
jgi:excinuclease ABC subunit A